MRSAIVDLLFPAQCAGCNLLGTGLCAACRPRSGPIEIHVPGLRARAVGAYEGALRSAVLALKDGRRDVAEALGALLAPLVGAGTLLVPVPTTARRLRARGVDGVRLIAQTAARIAGASTVDALVQSAGDAQRGRSRAERIAARGRFVCGAEVRAREVVLVDDVCTTGATLRDCAAAVRHAGGTAVWALVVAAASKPSEAALR